MDRQINNANARNTTLLLFIVRLLTFRDCLSVSGSGATFSSARWTLLQVCLHVLLDKDIFNILFLNLLKLIQSSGSSSGLKDSSTAFELQKLHQGSSNFSKRDWNDALSTVSAPKIEGHAKIFRKYCPNNVYISMVVAYRTKRSGKLPAPSELPQNPRGVQQHVEFIDRLKDARKRTADDGDSNDED
ncbi:MAG: hypothetical protein J3R72DRAFT_528327 [Linnemannia gamsii]|nr:MAG: hypothetical protein J3R72DRAFT_528327 [Linnemannia gamsii]